MNNFRPFIAGNGIAIVLTVLFVLPITGVIAFVATNPIDDWMISLGTWLHESRGWESALLDTQERFAKIGFAIRSIFIAVGLSFLYFWISTWVNQRLAGLASQGSKGRQATIIEAIQPWIFAGPAIVLLILFLLVPGLATLNLSLQDADGVYTVTNYSFIWNDKALGYEQFRFAMRNSVMWLVLVPTVCISLGLLIAVLADSVRWGVVAKTLIFVPMAISFVGAAVIWKNIFAGGGIEEQIASNGVTPSYQIGLLKALIGQGPENNKPLYALHFWGNFFLMWILVWVQTGFAMVIFSAALRGVPEDTIEAATIDGASPFQMFFRIKLPQIYSTVVVVWTTLVIIVLKMFDIPYALSSNDDDKLLLAKMMEDARNNWTVGSDAVENVPYAIAIMLMMTVVPILIFNARRLRREQREMGH